MPFGTILDPVFASPASMQITGYTRCGDSAIWTGHYLAAEAFRYQATGSADALNNVKAAIDGIRSLVDVTGTNLLARCLVPVNSPYATPLTQEESRHGVYTANLQGTPYYWIGNTSRDQYSGVFFGLGVAHSMANEASVRAAISQLGTRMLEFLLNHNWSVVMPNGGISTVFWIRPDQQLALLQVGRLINAGRFGSTYETARFFNASSVANPIALEVLDDHNSYFKFNLDTINLYNLIRLENSSYYEWWYRNAYNTLRRTTDGHGNAHFNMIDRGLNGANAARDGETRALLDAWLTRPPRDDSIDLRGRYASCGSPDRACAPIAVAERVRGDFLWQRSPFLLYGGDQGLIEGAGIDYILPYWMARHYGTISGGNQPPAAVSVTPSSGSGQSQAFNFLISDPDGFQDVPFTLIVANPVLSAASSCYMYFDRTANAVYLANDPATLWTGPVALGSPGNLQNSQCSVNTGASSSAGAANDLRLSLSLGFKTSGVKNLFIYAQDRTGANTGWQQKGVWTVP